jgi:hypothetical protein
MATNESRTLQILATVKDLASSALRRIGATIGQVFGGAAATLRGFRGALNATSAGISGLVGALAVRSGINAFQDLAEGLAAVSRSAQQIGATASSLYLLRNAAAENGVQFEQLSQSLVVFEKNIGQARQGGQEQQAVLRQLGLSSEQFVGSQRNVVEQLALVADAFGTVQDQSARTSLATKLFGDAGAKLLPLLSQGGQSLRSYAAAQRAAGLALSDKDLQNVLKYQRTLASLGNTLRTLGEQVVVQFAPLLTKALEDIRASILSNAPQIKSSFASLFEVLAAGLVVLVNIGNIIALAVNGYQQLGAAAAVAAAKVSGTAKELDDARKAYDDVVANRDKVAAGFQAIEDGVKGVRDQIRQLRDEGPVTTLPEFVVTAPAPEVQSSYDKFWDGFKAGATQSQQALLDWRATGLAASRQLIDNGINGFANAFADIITRTQSVKEAFRSLAKSILSDLARIIAKLLIVRLLENTLFRGGGGGSVPATTAAAGLGESSLGATLAGSGGFGAASARSSRSLGASLAVGGGGGDTFNVTYEITAMDSQDVQRALVRNRGTIRSLVEQDLKRNRNMRSTARAASR